MSSNRKYLIAFQIRTVNSLILVCTLPPRGLKTYKGLFNFHSFFRFAGISWSLFPTVTVLICPFAKLDLQESQNMTDVSLFQTDRVTLTWESKWTFGQRGSGEILSCAAEAKGFPRRLRVPQSRPLGRDDLPTE